jgi:hypothetical protein
MPSSIGTDAPSWSHQAFVHLFADAFLEAQPQRSSALPLPDPADFGLKETPKEAAIRLATKLNATAFPLKPTVEYVAKVLNSVHALIPKSLDNVMDNNEDSVAIRRAEQAFSECAHFLDDYPVLSQNEIECERFLQQQMRKIRSLGVGDIMLFPAGWANIGPTARPVMEQIAEREKDPKLPGPKPEVGNLQAGLHVGMNHWILCVLDRPSHEYFRFTVINQTLGSGLEYHPVTAAQQPYIERKLSYVIDEVPVIRLHDSSFWFMLMKLQIWPLPEGMSGAKFLYETLLPYLNNKPLYQNMAADDNKQLVIAAAAVGGSHSPQNTDALSEWHVEARNGDPHHIQICLEAVHYMLRALGVSRAKARYFSSVVFKWSSLKCAYMDLVAAPSITSSDAYLLQLAMKQLSFSVSRVGIDPQSFPSLPSGQQWDVAMQPTHVLQVHELIDTIQERLHAIYASPNLNTNTLTLESTVESNSLASSRWMPYPLFDRLKRDESVEHLAGGSKIPPIYRPVELTLVADAVKTFEEAATALRHCDHVCQLSCNALAF